jgi:hypothetical protein
MIIYYYYIKKITISVIDIYLYYRYGGYLVKIDGYNTNKGLGQLISNHNLSHVWIGKDSCQKTFPFNNISAISWRPVLVMEEAGVPGENHRPWARN